ncbi:MAG: TonB-dependent receptor [candidate division KSB1 bacterium]|nr:TonB-dependent receptor [candidate division KSB1 bacterium]
MRRGQLLARAMGGLVLALGWVAAMAADTQRDSVKYYFRPIVVTANRLEGPQREVDATVTVLPAAVPRFLGASTVHEALAQATPGVYLTQRGVLGFGVGSDAAGGITIRGIGGAPNTEVLMLIDGRPDLMGLMGHPLPDAYDLESAERIEVVRGPASVLYGSNAMGGVINVIPRKLTQPGSETQIKLRSGSWDTRLASLRHGAHFGRWDYYLTATDKHTDGHRPNSEFRGDNYTARLAYRPDPRLELLASGRVADFRAYDPGPVSRPYQDHWVDVLRAGGDFQVQGKTRLGTATARAFVNYGRHDIYDGWHSIDRTYGLSTYLTAKPLVGSVATLGADFLRYGGHAVNRKSGRDFGRHYVAQWAPYLHLRHILAPWLIVSGGLRLEHHQLFGNEWVPKLGLVWEPRSRLSLRFNVGKGFRSPTIRELYLFPAPTPNLRPERLWNYEIGLHAQPLSRLLLDLSGFWAEGSNLIRVEGRYPNLRLTNSGSFVHKGLEWDLTWRVGSVGSLRLFGSLLNPGEETRYSPKRRYGASGTASWHRWDLAASLNRVEELYGEDRHRQRLPDHTVLDFTLGYNLPHSQIVVRVQNALDTDYQLMLGYPMPGRSVSLELVTAL